MALLIWKRWNASPAARTAWPITEHHGLAVAAAVPHGVICLLSTLGLHGIGRGARPSGIHLFTSPASAGRP